MRTNCPNAKSTPLPLGFASDEAFASIKESEKDSWKGLFFAMGQMVDKYSNDFFRWGELYVSIRMANIVIARIGECTDITDFERRDFLQNFYKKTASSYRSFSEFSPQNGCFLPAEIQKAAQNFTDYFQADAHVRADVDSGLIDFLSFKLIRKTHFLRELINFERQANNDRLSLREEYER